MQPTTLNKLKNCKTPISVFDTIEKKLVLIFESKYLCAKYLEVDHGKIDYAYRSKKIIEKNLFGIPLAIRYSSKQHVDLLENNEFKVLDDRFTIDGFVVKKELSARDFSLENKLKIGDVVTLKYGRFAGKISKVTNIIDDMRGGFNTKKFGFMLNGEEQFFLSSALEIYEL